jgi:hypothetical protein
MKKLNLNQKINKNGKATVTNQWPLKKRTYQIWEKKLLLPKAGRIPLLYTDNQYFILLA